ncbi:MAG: hypothetical protein Ta2B_13890 [Termitinemataceae bacterium]|nr:MAG: hypothetical protein Ta2B_13890 [Termitinemataceae bacterium]
MAKDKSVILDTLREYLDNNKMYSRKGLSIETGISEQTISSWLNKGCTPKAETLLPICEYLHISFELLLTGKPRKDEFTQEQKNLIYNWVCLNDEDQIFLKDFIAARLSVKKTRQCNKDWKYKI